MSNPKIRFSLLLAVVVGGLALLEISFGLYSGAYVMPWLLYFQGAFSIMLAVGAGVGLVWLANWLLRWRDILRQEQQTKKLDEEGSRFNFPVSLPRFMPDVLVPPLYENITPLERELLGFWQAYNTWPSDPKNPSSKSLAAVAEERWQSCRDADPFIRIAALALDLGMTYAVQEIRKPYPWWQFWRRDAISFRLRCRPHRGLDIFVLSTFGSFRNFSHHNLSEQASRRALLCAIRFYDNPQHVPYNVEPLTKHAINELHRRLHTEPAATETTPESALDPLRVALNTFGASLLEGMNWGGAHPQPSHDGVLLAHTGAVVQLRPLLTRLLSTVPAEIRTQLKTWTATQEQLDTLIPLAAQVMLELEWLHPKWEGVESAHGLFPRVELDTITLKDCVVLDLTADDMSGVRARVTTQNAFNGALKFDTPVAQFAQTVKSRAERLSQTFNSVMQEELGGND